MTQLPVGDALRYGCAHAEHWTRNCHACTDSPGGPDYRWWSCHQRQAGSFATIDGKPVAVRGDRANCRRHHGVFAFVEADDSSTFNDLGIVRQGHRLACGCHALSTLGASFDVTPTSPQAGVAAAAASGMQRAGSAIGAGLLANAVERNDSAPPFSGRFELLDETSGQPVAGRHVRLSTPSGKQLDCVTDAQGMTDWLASDTDEPLMFQLVDADGDTTP